MARRPLPTPAEAAAILARKRTRPQRSPPPPAGRRLNKMLKQLDAKYGQGPGALQARWREIVGDQIAARTEPIKLIRGVKGAPGALELRVAGAGAALIQHQAPEIVERVNLFLGAGAINRLRIIQGPLQNLVPKGRPARRSNPPLDAALEAELAQGMASAPDTPLKEALMKLGRSVLKDRRSH